MKIQPQTCPIDAEAGDEEYITPCAEALMAATLALITGHAQCACTAHREMMAKKAVSNLFVLSRHPQISVGLRAVANNLCTQWGELVQSEQANQVNQVNHGQSRQQQAAYWQQLAAGQVSLSPAEQSRALWHTTPETIQ